MNITISASLTGQQKKSAETKQQLGRQKLISRELMLVNMKLSKYVQYASKTDDKKKNEATSPWQGKKGLKTVALIGCPQVTENSLGLCWAGVGEFHTSNEMEITTIARLTDQ